MTSKEIVPHRDGNHVATNLAALPPAVKGRISDLMVAFATASNGGVEKRQLLRLYAEVADSFPEAIVVTALDWLKFHNPRNPFHPTPQDVHETCVKVRESWRSRVTAYFGAGAEWPQRETDWQGRQLWALGAEPFCAGCAVPEQLVQEFLATWVADTSAADIAKIGRDRLSRIPAPCFGPTKRDQVLDCVVAIERAAAAAERERIYAAGLDPNLRRARADVLYSGLWDPAKPEAALIAEAKRRLAAEADTAARRERYRKATEDRASAHQREDVKAALVRMHAAQDVQDAGAWKKAADDYVQLLASYGAEPHPQFSLMMPARTAGRLMGVAIDTDILKATRNHDGDDELLASLERLSRKRSGGAA
jgi:hypothetical protein